MNNQSLENATPQAIPPSGDDDGANGVRLLTLTNPTMTELTTTLCAQLLSEINEAKQDPATKIIVLRGANGQFASTAKTPVPDALWAALDRLTDLIERCRVPVLALLEGEIAAPGAALALACPIRVTSADMTIRFADPHLGQAPRAGISQRLPRLAGAEVAVDLLMSGRTIDARTAVKSGLIDGLAKSDINSAGLNLARKVAAQADPVVPVLNRRNHLEQGAAYQQVISDTRGELVAEDAVGLACLTAVEAALLLPAKQGLDLERELAIEVADLPLSRALSHMAAAVSQGCDAPYRRFNPKPVKTIACIGHCAEGTALAVSALEAGIMVRVLAKNPAELRATQDEILQRLDRALLQRNGTIEDRNARLQQLTGAVQASGLNGCDAVFVKNSAALPADLVLRMGDAVPIAIFGNSSVQSDLQSVFSFDAASATRAGSAVEVGWFAKSDRQSLVTLHGLLKDLGNPPILWRHDRSRPPLMRLREATWAMGLALVQAGAHPARIDLAMQNAGFHILPFSGQDRIGLEQVKARLLPLGVDTDLIDSVLSKGWTGRATGHGWFSYASGSRTAEPNSDLDPLLPQGTLRAISPKDVVMHMTFAMANESLRIWADGGVRNLDVIDAAVCNGGGAARSYGGPIFAAKEAGLLNMQRLLQTFSEKSAYWTPHWTLQEGIKQGGRFDKIER